jgi:cystathionine beta-lyase family protein involved in aluminum resistance
MTSPGIGKEQGLMFNQTRNIMQGLFIAPKIVSEALKGAIFCSFVYDYLGYKVNPKYNENRSDIIQSIQLGSKEALIHFCQSIQESAPIDAYVNLEPWDMPGYSSKVIMAAGAFIQGSSIELSADAPIREPYITYFQGGLTYEHSKIGVLKSLSKLVEKGVIEWEKLI